MTPQQRRDALLRHVMRCRRRLQWLLLVRHALVAVPTAMAVAAAIVLALRADRADAAAWLGGALVFGLAAAACAASWLAPGQRATAAALDEELQLDDRVVTALQFLFVDDPIAGLIVRDSVDRLSDIDPAQVFPLDVRISRRMALLPAAALVLAVTVAIAPEAARDALVARPGGASLAGSARPAGKEDDRRRRDGEGPQGSSITTSAHAAGVKAAVVEKAMARREGADSAPPRATEAEGASSVDRSPEQSAEAAGRGMRKDARAGAAGAEEGDRGSDGVSANERSVARADAPASLPGAGTTGAAGVVDKQRQGSVVQGGVIQGGATRGVGIRAGGIQGGRSLNDFPEGSRLSGPSERSYPTRYHGVWARVQASLARNDVPPSFRAYLRDYFVAIRPSERE